MNVALMIGWLIFGASVVGPPTGDDSNAPGLAPPTTSIPLQPELRSAVQKNTQQRHSAPPRSSSGHERAAPSQQPGGLPIAPTDNGSDTERPNLFLPPTAEYPSGGAGGGRPQGFYGPSRVPTSPTHPRPGQSPTNASQRDAQLQQMRMEAVRQSAMPTPQSGSKAFAGTPVNTGGVSPYMNLFRNGNSNGTIDNYSTLVRPELEQRRTNQRFNAGINDLENSSRVQGLHINQLNRQTQNLQGIKAQQYFMNYGDYYQNAR